MALSPQQIEETQTALERHNGNIAAVARELGLTRSSVRNRLDRIRAGGAQENAGTPIRDQFSSYLEIHGPARAQVRARVKEWKAPERSSEPVYRVLAIGDPHDKPGRDKERFAWIGRHALETKPDAIVCIGDMASLDSLSSHELPGSANDADRPSFHEDLDSLDEALSSFHRHLPAGQIPTYITLGNHEYRAWRSANKQPKQCGDMPLRLEQVFLRWRWKTVPFGEFLELYDVDFVHVPLSIMGREIGGELAERTVGLRSLRSVVMGHTHVHTNLPIRKVGQNRKIRVVNLGTSMPHGIVEKYNGVAMTGWDYGICELRIQGGVILSVKHIDMLELEAMYA